MNNLISIIVPVYNVDKYLDRCINSILKQTYSNLEVLLIDDGSTDNSRLICDKYASEFNNVRVYHKKNGGISSARNYGLERISDKANYVAFVDADDFLHPQMYEILYDNLIKYECDIAICNIEKTYSTKVNEYISEKIAILNREEYLQNYFDDFYRSNVVWNKLYKRKCIEKLKFEEGKIYEDIFYSPQVICNTNKIVINESKLYYYYQRQGSILHGAPNINGWNNFFEASESLVKVAINTGNDIFVKKAADYYLGTLLNRCLDLYHENKSEYANYKVKYNNAVKKYILKLKNWKSMVLYILFYININFYICFFKYEDIRIYTIYSKK